MEPPTTDVGHETTEDVYRMHFKCSCGIEREVKLSPCPRTIDERLYLLGLNQQAFEQEHKHNPRS